MKEINVGIDLGTTYSAVAVFDSNGGKVDILKNKLEEETTPSVVCIENGEVLIGVEAKNEQAAGNENVAAFYKSLMGNEREKPYLDGREYTAEELSGIFLRELKKSVEEANNVIIKGAVITVPAYFNEAQRQATIRAGEAAGLKVLKIINEPTAAIIAYGLTGQGKRNVMVYDLGGGTFDVTIAEINGTNVDVIATNGNHQLGGKNWDSKIADYIIKEFNSDYEVNIEEFPDVLNELYVKCEKAKKQLTNMPSVQISINCDGNRGNYTITREQFDEMTSGYLNETLTLTEICFKEIGNGFNWNSLDEVVLVGGSTRMPQVAEEITRVFGKAPRIIGNKVDTIVATGAAMQAGLSTSSTGTISLSLTGLGVKNASNATLTLSKDDIKDVTAHGLGILATETEGKNVKIINSIILAKNSKIGVPKQQEYHSQAATTEVYVLQGELTNPFECTLLDKYVVSGLKGGSMNDFYVVFLYNQNGVVEVTAKYTDGRALTVTREKCVQSLSEICRKLEEDYKKIINTPYTQWAGVSNIPSTTKDKYGNPQGGQYDLAKDGAFEGYEIIALNFCNDGCDNADVFEKPKVALRKKGFYVREFEETPDYYTLKKLLSNPKSQLWIVSGVKQHIDYDTLELIADYYKAGHGIYIWGDNDPWYVDANVVLDRLFGTYMDGNMPGQKVISIQKGPGQPGIIENHPITTGIVSFYEGHTVATVHTGRYLKPLVYGSDRTVITAYYDENGRRVLADGGYTRLYCNWDTAGTDRYVVNAASWLANVEKFGYNSLG